MHKTVWILAVLGASAAWAQAPDLPAGQKIELDLGTKRVNWTNGRWVVVPLGRTVDLSGYAGVKLTVTTDQPRGDAGVYLAVREAGGAWYAHPWAADLTQKENTGLALFDDFTSPEYYAPPGGRDQDTDSLLDRSQIDALAFGCINPFGVGRVSFTIKAIALTPAEKPAAEPLSRVEATGRLIDINGTTMLPAGLFGGYHLPPGAPAQYRLAMYRNFNTFGGVSSDPITNIHVNCYGDRGVPSPILGHGWQGNLTKAATAAALKAKETGKTYYMEWWNEPYLNWSNKNRTMFNWTMYDDSRAVEGGPVHLKVDGSVCPHLKWTRNFDAPPWQWIAKRYTADGRDNWRRGRRADGQVVGGHALTFGGNHPSPIPASHPPKDVPDGQKYTTAPFGELTAFTPWWVYDETQFTYWSAKGIGRFYNEPMLVVGKALKAAYPKTYYIAGWGFRPSEDHWEAFRLAYQPTIDYGHEVIDGIHDHDYGGDAIKMPSSYELITAYGVTRYGKWLTSWNTETASGADPEVYGPDNRAAVDQRKFTWTARKLLHALRHVPDKARSFAWFGLDERNAFSANGEGILFTMLLNLRGRLTQVKTDDPLLYAVAAIDGADPDHPRPAALGPGRELVVTVLNDHESARSVDLDIRPPAGTTFRAATLVRPVFNPDGSIQLDAKAQKSPPDRYTLKTSLAAKQIISVTLPLAGELTGRNGVAVRQYFSPELLAEVRADKPSRHRIAIQEDELKGARRAWLRLVVERVAEGEGVVAVNGKDYVLPKAVTPESAPWIRELPVAVADLKAQNELVFRVARPECAGYSLACASLWIERE